MKSRPLTSRSRSNLNSCVSAYTGFSFSTGFVQATIPRQDRVLLHRRNCQRSERAAHDGPGTENGGLDDRIVQVRARSGRGARVRVVVHLVDEVLDERRIVARGRGPQFPIRLRVGVAGSSGIPLIVSCVL